MNEWISVSIIGRDRPGIVAGVARVLYESHCSIDELSQTALKGQFAMVLIASKPPSQSFSRLSQAFRSLGEEMDLDIRLRKISPSELVPFRAGETEPFIITVRGEDRPGLVYGITEVLAVQGINITNLGARVAQMNEKSEYIQIFQVEIPKDMDYDLIQEKLRQRGGEMGVAVDLQHREIFRAINQI